ncbi:hypothetical protein KCP78_10500 [Salmonella enterica subsp. enterica]|nr:hypothetical protein KCP78_10500 [Salmonella enterica subsp. enterica]
MPTAQQTQFDAQTASQWIDWFGRYAQEDNRFRFSWVRFNGTNIDDSNQKNFVAVTPAPPATWMRKSIVLNALARGRQIDNTVVIITAGRGIPLTPEENRFDWSQGHSRTAGDYPLAGDALRQSVLMCFTDHTDVMTTLTQRLPRQLTPANEHTGPWTSLPFHAHN